MEYRFYVWITLLTKESVDRVTARFIKQGWGVKSLAPDGTLFLVSKGAVPSALLGVDITIPSKADVNAGEAIDKVSELLRKAEIPYHSVIAIKPADWSCSWNSGKISEPPPPDAPVPAGPYRTSGKAN